MTPDRYSRSAIVLHWAIALSLAFQLGMGWYMVQMQQGAGMYAAFQVHKSVGIAILFLSVGRLALRSMKPRPAEIASGVAARWLARGVHGLLYFVMIAGPLTGWAVVSTARVAIPTRLFGLIPLPHLPLGQPWHPAAEFLHGNIAWLGAGLFALHVAGALRHHLGSDQHDVLGRMIPGLGAMPSATRSLGAAALALALVLSAFTLPWLGGWGSKPTIRAAEAIVPQVPIAGLAPNLDIAPAQKAAEADVAKGAAAESPASDEADAHVPKPSQWRVSPGGRLGFVATMNGEAINGRFDRWSADILFDPDALKDSRISVTIGLLSADTGEGSRDEMLKGADFFGAAGNEAVYVSRSIRRVGHDRYVADGSLTMNGKARQVPLSFTLLIDGDSAAANGTARLDRTSFAIGSGQWAATDQIAAAVAVNFKLLATRRPRAE